MDTLAAARIQTVRDHMRLECESDWDGVIATFAHPRYELYGAGTVFDGEAAVRGYFAASRTPFPDQGNEIIAIAADGDAVLVEFWLTGTHLGPLRTPKGEIAPTGKAFRVRIMASFEFAPGSAKIICERPYYDRRAVITALGWTDTAFFECGAAFSRRCACPADNFPGTVSEQHDLVAMFGEEYHRY